MVPPRLYSCWLGRCFPPGPKFPPFSRLMSGRLGGRMQPVLRHFMGAAGQRFYFHTIKMVERQAPFSDRIGFLDRFHDISLGEGCGFEKRAAGRQLRGDSRRECTTRAVGMFDLYLVAAQLMDLV